MDWSSVRRAREALADRYLQDPDVRLIDIVYESEREQARAVIRVYARDAEAAWRLDLPDTLDGVPVRAVVPGYRRD